MSKAKNTYQPSHAVRQASKTNIATLFKDIANQNPDNVAIIEGDQKTTYGELHDRVGKLVGGLIDEGLVHGDRVALIARNCTAHLEIELACAELGLILVSLNWRLAKEEISHCLQLTEPKLVFSAIEFQEVLPNSSEIRNILFHTEYENLIRKSSIKEYESQVDAEDGLVIIFTSGTTGLPKGALISHRALITRALIFASETHAPKNDTFIAWSPLFHMGSNDFSIATLINGGQVVIIDGYNAKEMIKTIETYSVHYLTVVPGMIEDFVSQLKTAKSKPKPIGLIGAMADLVPRPLLKEITTLLNAPYWNTFGSTETGNPPASANLVSIGTAPESLPKKQNNFCEIRLVDPDDNDVPDGEPGELAIRGPSLFSGYWANEDANEEAFRNGWFHMGDVFRRTPDGLLEFVDRVKYMIKSGGENIYPAEIEKHIISDSRVIDVAVVRKPDEKWGEIPVAFVACNTDQIKNTDIIDLCRDKIANYKLPKEVFFIESDDIPRNFSGKIQRHILEQQLTSA
ncbi:MAG: class I adenylate-forming enzyme family protein [Pseudomonadota bacterium]|nr:class I adenylate-forming enzyme family protein [Pseudomonadota bacterium]